MSVSKTRLIATVSLIPVFPESITVREIQQGLARKGFKVKPNVASYRTIQRDLNHIKAAPTGRVLVAQEDATRQGNPFTWCWKS